MRTIRFRAIDRNSRLSSGWWMIAWGRDQDVIPGECEKPEPEESKDRGRRAAFRRLSERNDEADKREQRQERRHHDLAIADDIRSG